jgi:Cdc6-like AAA superfamily ATPase
VRIRPLEVTAPDLHNLPTTLTSLVGRDAAIARLEYLLDPRETHSPPARLLTLTGAGGSGKTRLAIEVARRSTGEFSDGVWFARGRWVSRTRQVGIKCARCRGVART